MDFKKYLSDRRIAVPTPDNICDELGNCCYGTFEKEFPKLNMLKVNKPSPLPNFFNKYRLNLWEAAEINFDKVILLTAVCDVGLFGTALTVIYDKRIKKCTYWKETVRSSDAVIAETLINSSETCSKGKRVKVRLINNFERGDAIVTGYADDKQSGTVDYRLKLKRASKPCVVSIPFDSNRPLYTQKDLFAVEGYLEFNGERFEADASTVAIIDDHKGYYPRKSHYDWVTTMGKKEIDGTEQYFGINLTRNQSVNQDDFNENIIWFEDRISRLTPVIFKHKNKNQWHVEDTKGMVDVTFDIGDRFVMKLKTGIINIDYHITFGELRGFVCDEDGNRYRLDGMSAIGEDKSLLF